MLRKKEGGDLLIQILTSVISGGLSIVVACGVVVSFFFAGFGCFGLFYKTDMELKKC